MGKINGGLVCLSLLLGALVLTHCASQPIQVFSSPPPTAYRTLGMVSGQGENEVSAVSMAMGNAEKLNGDALVIESRRNVGRVMIVTCRVIRFLAPPPPQ